MAERYWFTYNIDNSEGGKHPYPKGSILYASNVGAFSALEAGSEGQVLTSTGLNGAPVWANVGSNNNSPDIQGLTDQVAANETKLNTLETSCNDLTTVVSTNETKLTTLETQLNDLTGVVSTNETKLNDLETNYNNLETNHNSTATLASNLETKYNELKSSIITGTNVQLVNGVAVVEMNISTNDVVVVTRTVTVGTLSGDPPLVTIQNGVSFTITSQIMSLGVPITNTADGSFYNYCVFKSS